MIRPVFAGQRDLERAAERLASRLPAPLGGLARLAYNYHWSWQEGGAALFRDIDTDRWRRVAGNPVALLEEAGPDLVAGAAGDRAFVAHVARAQAALAADLARPHAEGPLTPERPGAFFCAEFALHVSLPIYSGGLGALAGDLLKQASDDALAARRRRAALPAGLLPPANRRQRTPARVLVGHRPGAPAGRARHGRRRRARHRHGPDRRGGCRRPDLARRRRARAAVPARQRPLREQPHGSLDRHAAVRRPTPTCASPSTCCSASAACAR